MTHPFTLERNGRTCQLQKHPRDRALPAAELALRPWYIRLTLPDGSRTWKKVGESHETEIAIAAARALIIQARAGGNKFEQLQEATRYRAALTVGAVLDLWIAAGYPQRNGDRRTPAQQKRQAIAWRGAAAWWTPRALSSVNEPLLNQYAVHRRATVHGQGDGTRVIDLELVTLSNALDWAIGAGHALKNPFEDRPTFYDSDHAKKAWMFMPNDDDELHRLLSLLMSPPSPGGEGRGEDEPSTHKRSGPADIEQQTRLIAGAQLCFQAMTGLRSGEPGFLRWDAKLVEKKHQPGHRYAGRTHEYMAIKRLKGGTNPTVELHPALQSFLAAWQPFAMATWPNNPHLFPDPTDPKRPLIDPEDDRKRLNNALDCAVTALGLSERRPHGMRAFYVRVRRSQGIRDAVIAEELGQGSGPDQIKKSYGDPEGLFDCGQFDWLPTAAVRPCWEHLTTPQTNLLTLPAAAQGLDTVLESKLDTTSTVPKSPEESQEEKQKSRANG